MIYYRVPLHLQAVFANLGYRKGDLPVSEEISEKIFSIPMHPYIDNDQQNMVIEALLNVE